MQTWLDIVACSRAHFAVEVETDDFVGLRWAVPGRDPIFVKISQTVILERLFVVIVVNVCDAGDLDPGLALEINAYLHVGHFTLEDGRYLMRERFLLADIDKAFFARVTAHLARQADGIRRTVSRTRPASLVASLYAD